MILVRFLVSGGSTVAVFVAKERDSRPENVKSEKESRKELSAADKENNVPGWLYHKAQSPAVVRTVIE
jgi:hypothetical protein